MNRYHIYNSGMTVGTNDILVSTHNAGLFSNHSIALQDLMIFYNTHHKLPDVFDRTAQYLYYRTKPTDNLLPVLFQEQPEVLSYDGTGELNITHANAEPQFSDYKKLLHGQIQPFLKRYFMPSETVMNRVREFEERYEIDYDNTIGLFHRDNDKVRETKIATTQDYLLKAFSLHDDGMKYLVMPDNYEFLFSAKMFFKEELVTHIKENACMPYDKDRCTFMVIPYEEKPNHAVNFFATVIILSKCKHLVTHSGNGSLWACLYRGNSDNVHQYLNGEWI